MEIVRNENDKEVYFAKLKVGDIFVTANGNPNTYLKIAETYSEISEEEIEALCEGQRTVEEFEDHRCNAISLNDMQYHCFEDFDDVLFKPSKLIVE